VSQTGHIPIRSNRITYDHRARTDHSALMSHHAPLGKETNQSQNREDVNYSFQATADDAISIPPYHP
jgi:hypothetical protein